VSNRDVANKSTFSSLLISLFVHAGNCTNISNENICDSVSSSVDIYYKGEAITEADQQDMFALLIATIEAQAASGDFSEIGTVENIELTSAISNSTGSGLNIAKTAGIPAGLVGAFLVILGGVVIGWCVMRGKNDDTEYNQSENVNPNARGDVVEAEAIAIIEDDEGKDSKKKFNPSKFL
jgi:hypothetical protein